MISNKFVYFDVECGYDVNALLSIGLLKNISLMAHKLLNLCFISVKETLNDDFVDLLDVFFGQIRRLDLPVNCLLDTLFKLTHDSLHDILRKHPREAFIILVPPILHRMLHLLFKLLEINHTSSWLHKKQAAKKKKYISGAGATIIWLLSHY